MTKTQGATAALAILLGFAAPAAIAADTSTTHSAATTGSQTIQPNQMRASKVIGANVYDRDNQKVGSVYDLILDRDGRVANVVVDVGSVLGIGGKTVAVKMSDLKTDNNRLTLNQTKQQLQEAANYRVEDRNTGAGTSPSPVTGGHVGSGTSTPPPR
ncbi:MAG TPA: PRC-barrel domain-containing protein [Stellaceae bacterium]|nr:PRC-barrel domain-containing protein [Stellaceae bacterium]